MGGAPRLSAAPAPLRRAEPLLWALVAFAFYLGLQLQGPHFTDWDLYYHVKYASLLREHGWIPRLPWMAHTIHAERYVDYHFLFHWLQVPFVALLPDLWTAGKVSTAAFGAFSVAMLSLALRDLGGRHAWFWVLFFLLSSPIFTGRFLFGRAAALFVGVLFLGLWLLGTDRRRWLLPLGFLSVWTYAGFPVLAALGGLHFLARGVVDGRWEPRPLALLLGGMAAGFLIHPAFPAQFRGYALEFSSPGSSIAEWAPPSRPLLQAALALPAAAVVARALCGWRMRSVEVALAGLLLLLLVAISRSVKMFDYVVPVTAAFLGLADWSRVARPLRLGLAAAGVAAMLGWALPDLLARNATAFRQMDPAHKLDAARWLREHTPEGSLVLLPWDEFPAFFFANHHNVYPGGLNPAYSFGADRDRYLETRDFFQGRGERPDRMAERLGAGWAVVPVRDSRAIHALQRLPDERSERVYRNPGFVIYRFPAIAAYPRENGSPSEASPR